MESHPNDTECKGDTVLETAINSFQEFPWKEQLKIAAKRAENGITSSSPELIYANEKNEKLIVSASKRDGFHVFYETQIHTSEIFVSHDFIKNPSGLAVEEVIKWFFDNRMNAIPMIANNSSEDMGQSAVLIHFFDIRSSGKGKFLRPLLMIAAIICFCLVLIVYQSVQYGVIVKNIYFVFCLPLLMALPVAFLHIHYFFADRDKKIEVDATTERIIIIDKGETVVVNKKDILECAIVFNPNGRAWWSDYSYVRIKISESKSFVITSLIIDPYEFVELLQVNYKENEVFFPVITYKTLTEKEIDKRKESYEEQKKEFLEEFSRCETKKLKVIIEKPDEYADYAVAAAKEIIKGRDGSK